MSGTTAPGRGDAASPSRGLETAGKGSDSDAFADEHAYASLPLVLLLTSDEGFVEAARRRDLDGEPDENRNAKRSTAAEPSPAKKKTSVLTALFGALARLARRGGFSAAGPRASSDAASASAVFARALALGAMANIAPRCARVDAATAGKLVGALDAFERRERLFRARGGGSSAEALALGDLE